MFSNPLDKAPPGDRGPPQLERHSERLLIKLLLAKSGLHMHRRDMLLGEPSRQPLPPPLCVLNSLLWAEARPVLAVPWKGRGMSHAVAQLPSLLGEPWFDGHLCLVPTATSGTANRVKTGGDKAAPKLCHSPARARKPGKAFRSYRWLHY